MAVVLLNKQRKYIIEKLPLRAKLTEICAALACPGDVHFVFVRDAAIQQLNAAFRQQDKPTDVLSFPMLGPDTASWPEAAPPGEDLCLGDVVISLDTAMQQAERYCHELSQEILILAIHGLLHLLGYEHVHGGRQAGIMRRKETMLLQRYGFAEPAKSRYQHSLLARSSRKRS